ncbi:hypothetical protein HF851_08305 [Corynebacterium ammoniagenes]|uniref:hypothetical protein n=1 Tax=Corynebacterium ammoniagenes TaxID=1697 RepID=UPI001459A1A9|nr:hypothetical protein [Corynebacterium ammoniagenes]NMF32278.1 hypothetical protein [Corynebacterium ammoniagenes]
MTPEELIKFTGVQGPNADSQAATALTTAKALVGAYCRGREKRGERYRPGVQEVVTMVAARILANPEQISVREQVGPYQMYKAPGFEGFTLVELAVLNRYRKRAI